MPDLIALDMIVHHGDHQQHVKYNIYPTGEELHLQRTLYAILREAYEFGVGIGAYAPSSDKGRDTVVSELLTTGRSEWGWVHYTLQED